MKPAMMGRAFVLAIVCAIVFLPGIFSLPVTDRDEARFVQASRQMVESSDYLDIRFQDVPRYKKPIGIYWLQSAAAHISGTADDPALWSFRLVSFAGALIGVLATMWIGASMFGPNAGMIAGLVMAAAFGLSLEARIAKTDAFLFGVTVLAQAALAHIYLASRERREIAGAAPWLFWIAQGVGILVKGPVTPLVSLLTVLALVLTDRDRSWLKRLRTLPGLALAILIVLPWLVAITWKSGGAFWQEAVGRDLLGKVAEGQESHGFPPGYYSITYSLFLWPVGYLGLLAGLHALNRARLDPRLRFLLAWYVPLWIVLELIPTKLPHYMLPAYPAAAIAIGWLLASPDSREIALATWQRWLARLGLAGLAVVTCALGVLPLALAAHFGGVSWPVAIVATLAALAGGYLGSPYADRFDALPRAGGIAATTALFFGLMTGNVLPSADAVWPSREIAKIYFAGKPCSHSVLTVAGFQEPSMVFSAGTRTRLTDARGAARSLAEDPRCAVVAVSHEKSDRFMSAVSRAGGAVRPLGSVRGIDYSNGHQVDMTLYVAEKP